MNKTSKLQSAVFSATAIVLLFVVWQVYSITVNNPTLMPSFVLVLERLFEMIGEFDTYLVLVTSLSRLLLSIAMAAIIGTTLGLFSGVNPQVEAFLKPIIVTIRTLPVISIIIVVLIIVGNTITLYVISLLLLVPLIYQAVLDGIKHIDPLLIDVVKLDSEHATIDVLQQVYIPLSIPFLRSALIEAVGLGFKVLVIAEYIAQTQVSIGREIYTHRVNLEFSDVFAWTVLLLIFVLLIQSIVEWMMKPQVD